MSSPVLRTVANVVPFLSGVGPVVVAVRHDRVIWEYPPTLPRPSIMTRREEQEAIIVSHPPGALNCCHIDLSVEELPLDLEHDEISDVQLRVNTVLSSRCPYLKSNSCLKKHNFPSWSVEDIEGAGTGRGSTVSHLSPS